MVQFQGQVIYNNYSSNIDLNAQYINENKQNMYNVYYVENPYIKNEIILGSLSIFSPGTGLNS